MMDAAATPATTALHLPSLLVALTIMLAGSIYPLVLARTNGSVDHSFLLAMLCAMSAGLVRGVGFVPRALGWRLLFSGRSCFTGLLLAACIRWLA